MENALWRLWNNRTLREPTRNVFKIDIFIYGQNPNILLTCAKKHVYINIYEKKDNI